MKKRVFDRIKEQPPQTHRKVKRRFQSAESAAAAKPAPQKLRLRKRNLAFIAVAVVFALSIPLIFATAANTNEVAKIEGINMEAAASQTPEPTLDPATLTATTEGELTSDLTEHEVIAEPTPEPTPTPEPEPVYKVLSSGMTDEFVKVIQQRLMDLDYMGQDEPTALFGPITTQSIEYFQRKMGLPIDGVAGIETQQLLFSDSARRYTVSEGAGGPDVQSIQERLKELGYSVSADGSFGPATTKAVKYFQRMNGLADDGNVGSGTREALYSRNAVPSLEYIKAREDAQSGNTGGSSGGGASSGSSDSSGGGASTEAPAANPGSVESFVNAALAQMGKSYVLGGKGPDVFDCSGLVFYALKASGNGISYMTSYGWADAGQYTRIGSMSELRRGDVVCVNGHVGVYLGDGQIVHASSSNGKVVIASNVFNSSYWTGKFICGRRPL